MNHTRTRSVASFSIFTAILAALTSAQVSDDDRSKLAALPKLFSALGAKPGARIADVGSGDGFYTLQLARVVGPAGRVTACDISQAELNRLRSHMDAEKIENIDIVLSKVEDHLLAAGAFDAVFIRNAYHEMTEYASILRHIREALKEGGRLVIAEPIREKNRGLSRKEQTAVHQIAREFVEADLAAAGFEIQSRDDAVEPYTDSANPGGYWLVVATPMMK